MDRDDAFGLREEWLSCREWTRRALDEAYKSAVVFADAECDYQTIKHKWAFQLKDGEGLVATMIQMVIKGVGEVNSALRRRNEAELLHKVDLKAVDVAAQQEREAFKDYERALDGK